MISAKYVKGGGFFDKILGKVNEARAFEDVLDSLPEVSMSEGMIRRDNFFHNCWMMLKSECPDMFAVMGRVELTIAGYDPDSNKEITLTKEEKAKKKADASRQTL